MAKAKKKAESPFVGRWLIESMEQWDEDFINAEVRSFFQFDEKGSGEFQFGYVHGRMDCRLTTRDGEPAVEWTGEGNDEMDPAQGRGWAPLSETAAWKAAPPSGAKRNVSPAWSSASTKRTAQRHRPLLLSEKIISVGAFRGRTHAGSN